MSKDNQSKTSFKNFGSKASPVPITDTTVSIILDPNKDAQEIAGVLHTYWHMKERQWNRKITMTFTNSSKTFSVLYSISIAIIFLVYLMLQIFLFKRHNKFIVEYLLEAVLSIACILFGPRLQMKYRILTTEAYLFTITFFICSWYYQPGYYVPYLFCCVLFGLFSLFIYSTSLRLKRFYISQIRRETGSIRKIVQEDTIRYEIQQDQFFSSPHLCVLESKYSGLVEGESLWIDTSYQGEYVSGWFEHGEPVGPFESIENGTRNVLHSLRIIFATDAQGKYTNHRKPLHYGVAGVECNVSGNFYLGYPRCRFINGPTLCQCQGPCQCLNNQFLYYKHSDDNKPVETITVAIDSLNNLSISGFQGDVDDIKLNYDNGQIGIDERWLPIAEEGKEALIYIHGLNHTLVDALKRLGQLLALGHFPKHIIPFVFSWPSCSNPFLYCCAANVSSDNAVHRDLRRFLYSLRNTKIKKIHFLGHSLGTRFFLQSFSMLKELFAPTEEFCKDHGLFEVHNLILLSGDYDAATFVDDYPDFIPYIKHVSLYADSRDMALRSSKFMMRGSRIGQNVSVFKDLNGKKLDDIDVIDTGDLERNIDGANHGFFNINTSMIEDLQEVICSGKTAAQRTSRLVEKDGVYHFTLLPRSVKM
ncbi:hypothetical protein EHI8A_008670 [Entamoeba histolytica HM-1:IMSS-B]|uniref:Uncharacterized protein n=6 Tax=Entamoeba histolytica TaxID=5759 RepID=C4M7K7_ENTH1|nr:hypothetical protein EHI_170400 [Entamoeba histolytica HM-1:IMSS]EMD48973.1 Hypothetical protein EHI5A_023840 [Entamoeba histolytica KU27]EMH77736.1 hypothetical protein EHI8A_008670 [Entamoeba histolytica HM-1:IMSS-B]EMS14556.1 Hypothetical protein KM1_026620 [Entamoeba histolytica HM-3:IMSS]ENY64774.1 hypothetical protein EHI7A_011260 [Entamoeba histolytica HM-1:IMSS-A]GAT97515.1 hypothetical protein CL6EHI_170400 [Entamoeba histolytica]|eukprot:XP_651034.1 hypothetical protein EHI_170400 [Entamoeba histolytica HM-1:IMSS]